MIRSIRIYLLSALSIILSCSAPSDRVADAKYREEIETWHQRRIANLTKPDGWLSLAGRFWLQEGENRFGCGSDNPVRFPSGKCPDQMGSFFLHEGKVRIRLLDQVVVYDADSARVKEMELVDDAQGKPTVLFYQTLSWHVIKRGDRYAIRLRDTSHPNRAHFKGIDRYPVDPAWKVKAKFSPYAPEKKLKIVNVVGQVEEQSCPGALVFMIRDQEYRLDVLDEGAANPYFVIIADATSGKETYGGGRFLYVARADSTGETTIDFNKAYNPPCSFTPYATCPLPPAENRLAIAIRAGEKRFQGEVAH